MRCAGFVMVDETGAPLAVSVGGAQTLAKSLSAPESRGELVAEHERLVDVLRSPSHADDLAEAERQEAELREYEGDLTKAHVKGYARKDGAYVAEHDDKRPDANAKPKAKPGKRANLSDDHDFGAMLGAMRDGDSHHFENSGFSAERVGVHRHGDRFHFSGAPAKFVPQPKEGHTAEAAAAHLSKWHTGIPGERLVDTGKGAVREKGEGEMRKALIFSADSAALVGLTARRR